METAKVCEKGGGENDDSRAWRDDWEGGRDAREFVVHACAACAFAPRLRGAAEG